MNTDWAGNQCKRQRLFRLRFQQRLRRVLEWGGSAAVEFGSTWEATLNEVPLSDEQQARVYWELIKWTKGSKLFTGPDRPAVLHTQESA